MAPAAPFSTGSGTIWRIEALIIKEPGALQYLHHHRWVD